MDEGLKKISRSILWEKGGKGFWGQNRRKRKEIDKDHFLFKILSLP